MLWCDMGCYKIEEIDHDFETASNGADWHTIKLMSLAAKEIIKTMPDNAARDMAISHLLQAADMTVNSWLLHHNKRIERTAKSTATHA